VQGDFGRVRLHSPLPNLADVTVRVVYWYRFQRHYQPC